MRVALIHLLACVKCDNSCSLEIVGPSPPPDVITGGELRCTGCGATYPVRERVPNLLTTSYSSDVQTSFDTQWSLRRKGALEEREGIVLGNDTQERALRITSLLLAGSTNAVILDAGCGPGEVIAEIARRHPQCSFIGMDLTSQIYHCARKFASIPNLDWIQGDVAKPPFQTASLDGITSWGVLHHTQNTRSTFIGLARPVKRGGRFHVWLYPVPREHANRFVWSRYYFVRDYLFLGRAHHLPPRVLLWMVRLLCLPYLGGGQERYRRAQLNVFDCLSPKYQHRHARAEIERWFSELGFDVVNRDEPYLSQTTGVRR